MNEIQSLFVRLGLDNKGLIKGLDSSLKEIAGFAKGVAIVAAAVGAGVALYKFAEGVVKAEVELRNMSIMTGISINTLSQLDYVAKVSGRSLNDITIGMRGVANALEAAREPGSQAAKAFRELGLDVRELRGLAPEQLFFSIAEAISRIPAWADRFALAVDIFGHSGTQLLPIIDDLNRKMAEAAQRAQVFTPEDLQNLEAAHVAMVNLGASWEKFINILAKAVLPDLTIFLNNLSDILELINITMSGGKGWGAWLDRAQGGYAPPAMAIAPPSAGGVVNNWYFDIQGNVISEQDFADSIMERIYDRQNSNGNLGIR